MHKPSLEGFFYCSYFYHSGHIDELTLTQWRQDKKVKVLFYDSLVTDDDISRLWRKEDMEWYLVLYVVDSKQS